MTKKLLTVMLVLVLWAGVNTWGRVVGNWETEVTLRPETTSVAATPMNFAGVSTLIAGYFEGDLAKSPSRALSRLFLTDPSFAGLGSAVQIALQQPFMQGERSKSAFHLEGYHKQKLIIDYPVGTLGVRFDLALSVGEAAMQYLWKEVFVNYGGVSFTGRLSVMPLDGGLASGMGLKLRGNTFGGAKVELDNLFGMTTDIEEIQEGTGPVALPSFTQWKSTELSLTGLTMEWLHFDGSAKISKENAYEYTKFDFEFDPNTWLSFDLNLKLTPQTHSRTLKSTIDLDEAGLAVDSGVLYLYSRGFELRGFNYVVANDLTLSGIVALEGALYRGRDSDIGLRATGYYLDVALEDLTGYQKTDYVAILSAEGSFGTVAYGINYAGDVYWEEGASGGSWNWGLLTGEITYNVGLSQQLAFGAGIAIDPATDIQEVDLSIESWFYWY